MQPSIFGATCKSHTVCHRDLCARSRSSTRPPEVASSCEFRPPPCEPPLPTPPETRAVTRRHDARVTRLHAAATLLRGQVYSTTPDPALLLNASVSRIMTLLTHSARLRTFQSIECRTTRPCLCRCRARCPTASDDQSAFSVLVACQCARTAHRKVTHLIHVQNPHMSPSQPPQTRSLVSARLIVRSARPSSSSLVCAPRDAPKAVLQRSESRYHA